MRSARPRSRRGTASALAISAAIATVALGGCGGDSEPAEPPAEPVGEEVGGSVAPLAQCRDWNRGTEAEKLATIEEIRSQINLESSGVDAPPLSDEEAMEVFESACSRPFAAGFRLYVLYSRAAAFAPLARDVAP